MIEFVPFRPEHLDALQLQPAQAHLQPFLSQPLVRDRAASSVPALTVMAGDRVAGAGGVLPLGEGEGWAWSYVAAGLPRAAWLAVTRRVRRELQAARARLPRIRTGVRHDFAAGHEWARLLGFALEAGGATTAIDGADYCHYALRGPKRTGEP